MFSRLFYASGRMLIKQGQFRHFHTNSHLLPNYNEAINTADIITRYSPCSSELKYKLELACNAVNQTRTTCNLTPSNHPFMNHLSPAEAQAIIDKNIALQEDAKRAFTFHTGHQTPIELMATLAKRHQAGNCEFYTAVTADFIRKTDKHIPIKIYTIRNGDHVIGEIGDQVMFDALVGKVFPSKYMLKELNTFKTDKGKNIFAPYDPNIHSLSEQIRFYSTESKNQLNSNANNLSMSTNVFKHR